MNPGAKQKLLIIGPLPPPYSGPELGTESYLKSELLNKNYRVRHLNTTIRKENYERGKFGFTMVWGFIKYTLKLLRELLLHHPAIILYTPLSATRLGWIRDSLTLGLAHCFRIHVHVQFRGGHFHSFFNSLSSRYKKFISSILNRTKHVIVQSDCLKQTFHNILPPNKLAVVTNAISEEFFSKFSELSRPTRSEKLNVLMVGHLNASKGYQEVISASQTIISKYKSDFVFMGARFSTIGKSYVEKNILVNQISGKPIQTIDTLEIESKLLSDPETKENLHFLGGNVSGNAKIQCFKEADIFVLPSHSEGFSRAILEAMAAGLPIITTRVGANPDTLTENEGAIFVEAGDTAAVENAIDYLHRNPDVRLKMGKRNREVCKERFLQTHAETQLIKLFQKAS